MLWLRPQTKVEVQLPPGIGFMYCKEAVARTWSPGSSASGWTILPTETCAAQFLVGKNQSRVAQELIGPV